MKNIDRIRQMNSEELLEMLRNLDCRYCPVIDECYEDDNNSCYNIFKQWLEKEAEE